MKRQFLRFAPWVALMFLGVVGTPRMANTVPQEHYPRMRAAIGELRAAREEMERAGHDFCGHKVEAMRATDAAIRQMELAVGCARR